MSYPQRLMIKQRGFWRPLIGILVIVLLAVGMGWWQQQRQSYAIPLSTAEVIRADLDVLVTATGVLEPRDYVDVGAQVSGQLKSFHVKVGDTVIVGELLAEIDPTLFVARVDASKALLRFQRAQLADREAQLSLARLQAQRATRLYSDQAGSQESVQAAEATLLSAQAQREALLAQIEQTESTLRAEEANLAYAHVYAPMSGTVASVLVRPGQTLNATQQSPTLMRIADLATMTVRAQVSEADIRKLRIGMPVYFTTLGDSRKRWHGQLQRIEPTPEVINNVVLYNAVFEVPNPEGLLMTQMTAQVFFIAAQAKQALLIPNAALIHSGGKVEVKVMDAAGQWETREVKTGITNRVLTEVISGLAEHETVLLPQRSTGNARAGGGAQQTSIPRMLR